MHPSLLNLKAGRTALMAAAEQGHAETVSKLIESANVDAVDKVSMIL